MGFSPAKKVLFFLLFCFAAQIFNPSLSYALGRNRLHPSNVCASLLFMLRNYTADPQYLKEERDVAVDYLRGFRLGQLGYPTVDPSSDLVSISSQDKPSKNNLEKLAKRIRGIEVNSRAEGGNIDKRVWTFVRKYTGPNEINGYLSEADEAIDAVDSLTEQTQDPWYAFTLRKRSLQAAIFSLNAMFSPFWYNIGLHQMALAFGLLGVHSEPLAILSFLYKQDGFYKKNKKQIEDFLSLAKSGNLGEGFWSYDVQRYSIHREVIHGALGPGTSNQSFGEGLNSQAYHDTRGLWTRVVLQYPALIKTGVESPGSVKEKWEVFQNARDQWQPLYVSYDRLLNIDPATGEPILIVTVRTSLNRDPAKQFVEDRAKTPTGQFAPVRASVEQ